MKKQRLIVARFENFLQDCNLDPLAVLISNLPNLENALCDFLESLRNKKKKEKQLPTLNTVNSIRAQLKSKILEITDGKIDIANIGKFPKLRVSLLKSLHHIFDW